MDPFVHLHVASGYSMQFGASHPAALVQRAADHGMDALALTDRDGLYGAVRFVQACQSVGVRPILGVDLAVAPVREHADALGGRPAQGCEGQPVGVPGVPVGSADPAGGRRAGRPAVEHGAAGPADRLPRRTPAHGGAYVDLRLPRVTVLARDDRGWASLCRLVSATHLAGVRGEPVTTLDLVAEHVAGHPQGLFVLLGPGSELGGAIAAHRLDLALAVLQRWRAAVGESLLAEVVNHRGPGEAVRAARLLGFAAEYGVPAVLTNAVRHAGRSDGPVVDVLDAARRLVALDVRHTDRTTAEGYVKSGKEMAEVAEEVTRLAGLDGGAGRLLAGTRAVAERCVVDPAGGMGLGGVHFPEFTVNLTAEERAAGWGTRPAGAGSGADVLLRARCEAGIAGRGLRPTRQLRDRLEHELAVVRDLGYPSYFLTVGEVVGIVKGLGVRCAARGSGAGSLVNYLLGISDVDPLRYGLVMERFLSPLRRALPDIDVDVESARRTEVYEAVLERFGGERCTCVSMMDTYRARHALRDTGAALGLPPGEIDAIAKAFPHIRAGLVRAALQDLPELRAGLASSADRLDLLFRLAERLDGLPRHIAVHPCGVLLSDATLLDRTPVEASFLGFPMSQFDKDDVEALGLLKLDVLGIRMQSAIAHAVAEVARVDAVAVDVDAVPRDDPATFALIQSTRTLGCFQIESPGQRELVGKFAPETFDDIIIDISLFRPGPVKSDMVVPFLQARQGWTDPDLLHPDLEPVLADTWGVVVFHEQVLRMVSVLTGCSLAEADEVRRTMGDPDGQAEVQVWFVPAALANGYDLDTAERVWAVLKAFASFGFCKAHAAAFALPTYQSAWLKAHHPAAFLAGVLTHDPGMYPKRLILDDARQFGIAILPLDVNRSADTYLVERVSPYAPPPPAILGAPARPAPPPDLPDARGYGIRLALTDVKGISATEVARVVAGRPYGSLADFWHRAGVARPVVERLVVAGAFDEVYGLGSPLPVRRRGRVTRRDLLLQVAELDAWTRSVARGAGHPRRRRGGGAGSAGQPGQGAERSGWAGGPGSAVGVREQAAQQSQAAAAEPPTHTQMALDLGDSPDGTRLSGLPEMTSVERVHAELEVLGLDASMHILAGYEPFLRAVGVTRSRDLLGCRSRAQLLVAGVKVATQTPPIRSGRRVVFVTLDDATGPVDATFFEDAQVGYASTVFHSWLLVVRGVLRRTGPRGVSLRATGAWELPVLREAWESGGLDVVRSAMAAAQVVTDAAVHGAAESRSARPVMVPPAPGRVFASGFTLSPYADVKPPGEAAAAAPRKLWHSSPGSSGG